jgi:hypothetical protein
MESGQPVDDVVRYLYEYFALSGALPTGISRPTACSAALLRRPPGFNRGHFLSS